MEGYCDNEQGFVVWVDEQPGQCFQDLALNTGTTAILVAAIVGLLISSCRVGRRRPKRQRHSPFDAARQHSANTSLSVQDSDSEPEDEAEAEPLLSESLHALPSYASRKTALGIPKAPYKVVVWTGSLAVMVCYAVPILQATLVSARMSLVVFAACNAVCMALLYLAQLRVPWPAQRYGLQAGAVASATCLVLYAGASALEFRTAVAKTPTLHNTDAILSCMRLCASGLLLFSTLVGYLGRLYFRPHKRHVMPVALSVQMDAEEDTPLLSPADMASLVERVATAPTYASLRNRHVRPAEDTASWISKLVFWWISPLMKFGYQTLQLNMMDLLQLPTALDTDLVCDKFAAKLARCIRSADIARQHKAHVVLQAFNRSYGWWYYPVGILKLLADLSGFAGPLLLHELVSLVDGESSEADPKWGYLYAGLLCLSTLFGSLCNSHYTFQVNKVQVSLRAAIVSTVFNKSLLTRQTTAAKEEAAPADDTSDGISTTSQQQTIDNGPRNATTAAEETKPETPTATGDADPKHPSFESSGQVMNLMSTDCDRIANFCPSFHAFWSLPFQIAVALYLLYQQVGVSFLAGLIFAIILIPINKQIASKIGILSSDMMKHKDARVQLMMEILAGIRVVKMYAWEDSFRQRIADIRSKELRALAGRKYLDAVCVYLWATTPVLISILTFATYVLLGNNLTAATVFTSMSLFNILIGPLNAFPWVVNGMMEAWVSLNRVETYLRLEELRPIELNGASQIQSPRLRKSAPPTPSPPEPTTPGTSMVPSARAMPQPLIVVENASFSWEQMVEDAVGSTRNASGYPTTYRSSVAVLEDVSMVLDLKQLVVVAGPVGAGKSSLLASLLGETRQLQGSVRLSPEVDARGIGFCAQEPWIQNDTVRANILFGSAMDRQWFDEVLSACALQQDLAALPGGELTEIGENGVNLSGGQKARVALARAVYQRCPLYLLDDPLAALDAHVASYILENCIRKLLLEGLGCCVVLVTHNRQALTLADHIYTIVDRHLQQSDTVYSDGRSSMKAGGEQVAQAPESTLKDDDEIGEDGSCIEGTTIASVEVRDNRDATAVPRRSLEEVVRLTTDEERSVGVVGIGVYGAYWRAVGSALATAVVLSLFLMQASRNVSDWWLSYWVSHANDTVASAHDAPGTFVLATLAAQASSSVGWAVNERQITKGIKPLSPATAQFLEIYGGISAGNTLFTLVRAFLFAYAGVRAARVLHERMLTNVMQAKTAFFDQTPLGRLVNRFSSDIYGVDDSLPFIMNIFFAQLFGLLGTVTVTTYGVPIFAVCLLPLAALYYNIQRYYRQTSRELKRLGSVSRSPIYAHFSETLSGAMSIRALRHSRRFRAENRSKMNDNQVANYNEQAAAQWLGIRLQGLGVFVVTAVSFFSAAQHHFGGKIDAGMVGLSISYALSITGVLQGLVTSFTETEKEMVAVERTEAMCSCPKETENKYRAASALSPKALVPREWPTGGAVSFVHVSMRYRPDLPLSLSGVCFDIRPGEKLGIVGRTGAGKTSLFQALFRMTELCGGRIEIDGISIHDVPRSVLRSRLAIIPQDPVLFNSSLRYNLDPFKQYGDDRLWRALEQSHLADYVRQQRDGLESQVEERGKNLSVGQRQLLCLARALLRNSRIICIDEATASVDRHTDELVQETISREFSNSTVITIAHRMSTILHCDRVLVMHSGRVAELGTPEELRRGDTVFRSLLQAYEAF